MKYLILEIVWSLCSSPSISQHYLASYGKLFFSNKWKIPSLCSLCSDSFPLTIININSEKSMERSLVFFSGRVDSHPQAEFLDLYERIYFIKLIFITQTHNTGGRASIPLPMILFHSLIASTSRSLDPIASTSSLVAEGPNYRVCVLS